MTNPYRNRVLGVENTVPLLNGKEIVYTNLDNAASTPSLISVKQEADLFLEWYSSIHRGAGFKSQVASEWYELARQEVKNFLNVDPDYHEVIFTGNTTDAINRLAQKFPVDNDKGIIISDVEHHANDLPWRSRGRIVRVPVNDAGQINPYDLDRILVDEAHRSRLVSLSGASNVVGTVQPIHDLAKVAHKHGLPIAIDAAQLAPHMQINMQGNSPEERIDFLYISGHKMYAPYGGGALVGPKEFLDSTAPSVRGGGAVLVVEHIGVDWNKTPDRDEAGSPNVLGMITLAASMRELRAIGFETLEKMEQELTIKFLRGLKKIDGSIIYGLSDEKDIHNRLGVIAFNLKNIPHGKVAAALAHEYGIGVRNACFCAHPFVLQLMKVPMDQASAFRSRMRSGDKRGIPGAVRVSFGLYSTEEEVDRVLDALNIIVQGKFEHEYVEGTGPGEWIPKQGYPDYKKEIEQLRKR